MCRLFDSAGTEIKYDEIREAMGDEPFTMCLRNKPEIDAVVAAVNIGIDSHLEGCYMPILGDSYNHRQGKLCPELECKISKGSLPVLLRRLFETEGEHQEPAHQVGTDILSALMGGE